MRHFIESLRNSRNKGFTIVEVLIVITVIGLLVGLATFAATSYVKTSRDSTRESKSAIISSALEKYYDQNGEYPSVALMTSTNTDLVKQKLSITDKDVFKFPLASSTATNSIAATTPSTTKLVYTATTVDDTQSVRDQCQTNTNGYCDTFELRYVKESDNSTVVIKSQNNDVVAVNSLAKPTASVAASYINSSTIRFTASATGCGINNTEYKIRYNTTSASSGSMPAWADSWSTSTTQDINPGSYINFYVQSLARCVNITEKSSDSDPSSTITFVKPTPPPTPTVTASAVANSTNVTLTFTSSTATGYTVTGPGNASSCTSSPCTVTGLSASTYYTFNVVARNIAGSSAARSASVTTTSPPGQPSVTATAIGTSSTSVTLTWTNPGGATSYTVSGSGSASSCTSSPCTVTGLSGGTYYGFTVVANNGAGSGPAGVAYVTTTPAPVIQGSPLLQNTVSGSNTVYYWTAASCNVGTPRYAWNLYTPGYEGWSGEYIVTDLSYQWNDTTTQGAKYGMYFQAYCQNGSDVSTRSTQQYTQYVRPVTRELLAGNGYTKFRNGTGYEMWPESAIWSYYDPNSGSMSGSCASGTHPENEWRYDANPLTDPDNDEVWNSWRGYSMGTLAQLNSNVTEERKIEMSWHTQCVNDYTHVRGPENYSDVYGNIWIPDNMHRRAGYGGSYSKNCGGGRPGALGAAPNNVCDAFVNFPM